jgi:23S rRNA pseudouridine1911/1915/1917 synthase
MKEFLFKVTEKFNDYKVIDFLKSQGVSREIILKVKFGGIKLNQTIISNSNQKVKRGDMVTIILPPDKINQYVTPIKEKLCVLYEDEYLLAVKKEKGVLTHSSKHNSVKSLEQIVLGYLDEKICFRPINRLDRDTSGIVIVAKDMFTASLLSNEMKKGLFKKTYSAVVVGSPTEEHFFIEKPIKRQDGVSMKRVCDEGGDYAKTECIFISEKDGLSTLDIILHTGRTHQIRVHLASIGLPLYADSLYGKKIDGKTYELCAKTLEFTHPFTKERIKLSI